MLKGFKDFLLRGNVLNLAVAVVIGTAFTAIVTAFTTNIINPLIASIGANQAIGFGFQLKHGGGASTFINLGAVITATINFIIIAAVVYFLLILPANKMKQRLGYSKDSDLTGEEILLQIRDLLAQQHASAPGAIMGSDGTALQHNGQVAQPHNHAISDGQKDGQPVQTHERVAAMATTVQGQTSPSRMSQPSSTQPGPTSYDSTQFSPASNQPGSMQSGSTQFGSHQPEGAHELKNLANGKIQDHGNQ